MQKSFIFVAGVPRSCRHAACRLCFFCPAFARTKTTLPKRHTCLSRTNNVRHVMSAFPFARKLIFSCHRLLFCFVQRKANTTSSLPLSLHTPCCLAAHATSSHLSSSLLDLSGLACLCCFRFLFSHFRSPLSLSSASVCLYSRCRCRPAPLGCGRCCPCPLFSAAGAFFYLPAQPSVSSKHHFLSPQASLFLHAAVSAVSAGFSVLKIDPHMLFALPCAPQPPPHSLASIFCNS
ncbi:hypothetical protein BX070DRAFT_135270 [Coemansia spiralis]|nr:hypothetical protein BX070DRAFT_135270 [Coemansia spiralis]